MICPYCFKNRHFRIQKKKGSRVVYYCTRCKSEISKTYYESINIPLTNIGLVGYVNHGKTVFSHSMLYLLKSLSFYWENHFVEPLDDHSNYAINVGVPQLQSGKMFDSSISGYPRSIFLKLNNMPYFKNRFINIFDTGGRLFDNLEFMTKNGRYFANTQVVFFIISLPEKNMVGDWNIKIMKLLDRYINVVYSRYGIKISKQQNAAFIFTKADELIRLNGEVNLPENIQHQIKEGDISNYRELSNNTLSDIEINSGNIETWLRNKNCNSFINMAKNHFKNTNFSMVSSIPYTPKNGIRNGSISMIDPKRVLDPLIWALHVTS